MKRRLSSKLSRSAVFALTVAAVAPLAVAGPVGGRAAHAQPADAVTEVARQRYREGVKAYEAGRYEDARSAFLQAYALKRVPAVLLNLGQSELRTVPPRLEEAGKVSMVVTGHSFADTVLH